MWLFLKCKGLPRTMNQGLARTRNPAQWTAASLSFLLIGMWALLQLNPKGINIQKKLKVQISKAKKLLRPKNRTAIPSSRPPLTEKRHLDAITGLQRHKLSLHRLQSFKKPIHVVPHI